MDTIEMLRNQAKGTPAEDKVEYLINVWNASEIIKDTHGTFENFLYGYLNTLRARAGRA